MSKASIVFAFLFVLILYGGTTYYVGYRLFRWLLFLFPHLNGFIFSIIYSLIAFTLIVGFIPFPGAFKHIANWLGSYWMGFFIYFLLFFVLLDIVFIVLRLLNVEITSTLHFYGGLAVILLTIGFVSYGLYNATQLKHVSYSVSFDEKTAASGMKIVLISDLHLGAVNSENRLKRIVDEINQLNPDLVCIPGDIFNDYFGSIQNPEKAIETLKKLNATYGVYASLGNHDAGKTFSQMVDFLSQSNITLLNDEYTVIDDRLILVGRLDPNPIGGYGELKRKDIGHLFEQMNPDLPVVVMDHTPINLDDYGKEVDLIVSGHTHKGQVFPGNLITKRIFEVDYGHYRRNENSPQVIVTSGVGTWGMPMRVGTNNEIVSIRIH